MMAWRIGTMCAFVIAITANARAVDREACRQAGMDDFLTKPVRVNELQAALARGLRD